MADQPVFGNTPIAPVTTVTIGSDTICPIDVSYSDEDSSETAAHMQDHKLQRFLTTNTRKLTISWFGPGGPDLSVGNSYTVTVSAGSSTIELTDARLMSLSQEGTARGAWKNTATFELEEE